MPRHSPKIQQLIQTIAHTLDGLATVSEWLLLRSGNGTPYEVDIAIEAATGNARPVRIAVEVRDHARPADREWIEQVAGKYRDLAVQQVIAVATTGFTPAARSRATADGIRTLTLVQARKADWARLVHHAAGSDTLSLDDGHATARAVARPATRPENRHPPRNVPSSER